MICFSVSWIDTSSGTFLNTFGLLVNRSTRIVWHNVEMSLKPMKIVVATDSKCNAIISIQDST